MSIDTGAGPLQVPSGVGATALLVAWARAQEANADEPLFLDRFAPAFLDAAGYPDPDPAFRAYVGNVFSLRTKFFDDYLADTAPSQQPVVLAVGLDTRAQRVPLPASAVVYELDTGDVQGFRGKVLSAVGTIRPTVPVVADLRHDWLPQLAAAGWNRNHPTVWLIEGLSYYLHRSELDQLLAALTDHSAPGSTLAMDGARNSARSDPDYHAAAAVLREAGAPWQAGLDDPVSWLSSHGWNAQATTYTALANRYDRPVPPSDATAGEHYWLATATR